MGEAHTKPDDNVESTAASADTHNASDVPTGKEQPKEIGGRDGPDPTRYGDWEKNGRCIDF